MKAGISAILMTLCLLLPAHAFADVEVAGGYSDGEIVKILKNDGYSAVKMHRDGVIQIRIDGRAYYIFNQEDGDIQAFYSTSGVDISYETINKWNRTKRLSRAYLDGDKDPVLEADLLSDGGISKKNVTEFFRVFVYTSVDSFREFLIANDMN